MTFILNAEKKVYQFKDEHGRIFAIKHYNYELAKREIDKRRKGLPQL